MTVQFKVSVIWPTYSRLQERDRTTRTLFKLRELELDTDPSWVMGVIHPLAVKIFCWVEARMEVRCEVEFFI